MARVVVSRGQRQFINELKSAIREGSRYVLRSSNIPLSRSRFFAEFMSERPDAWLVRIPSTVDRTERILFELAHGFGQEVVESVARCLHTHQPEAAALDLLDHSFASRRPLLVVDDWHELKKNPRGSEELGLALKPRTDSLREWLAERAWIVVDPHPAQLSDRKMLPPCPVPPMPPLDLVNGEDGLLGSNVRALKLSERNTLWQRVSPDAELYELLLLNAVLQEDPGSLPEPEKSNALRLRIVECLPNRLCKIFTLLGIHGRRVPYEVFAMFADGDKELIRQGLDLGLWHRFPAPGTGYGGGTGCGAGFEDGTGDGSRSPRLDGSYEVDPRWSSWWLHALSEFELREIHRDLATTFKRLVDPADLTSDRAALYVLEAHRHFLEASEIAQARCTARYGVTLIVDAARRKSMRAAQQHSPITEWAEAAQLYEMAIEFAKDSKSDRRLLGYAHHYLHYNRARAKTESLNSTIQGYNKALQDWPDNALFWSRLIEARCEQGHLATALSDLKEAYKAVPNHPERDVVLRARTTSFLLKQGHLLEAAYVWGDCWFRSLWPRDVEDNLAASLKQGWRARLLALPEREPLCFNREIEIKVERLSRGRWLARFPELNLQRKSGTPRLALEELVEKTCCEARELVAALTAGLDSEARQRKRLILGAIDIIGSRLDAPAASEVWVFGQLEREDHRLWLRSGGSYDLWFEIPEQLTQDLIVDARLRFALVRAGPSGVPTGPILKLEPPSELSDEAVWDAWEERVKKGG